MKRAVSTVATTSRRPVRRAALTAGGVLVALALVAAFALRAAPHTDAGAPKARPAFVASPATAAAAALNFVQLLAVTGVQDPAVFGARLHQIAAPGADARVRSTFGAGAAQVRALIQGPSGVLRAAPLGYDVESISPSSATVAVWVVALAGGAKLEPVAQWRVLTLELVWTRSGWRIANGTGASGPSPTSPLRVLAAESSRFDEVRHVP
jgi:hypothetical protein